MVVIMNRRADIMEEIKKLENELKLFNSYESVVVLSPDTSVKEVDNIKKELAELVDEVEKIDELGLKRLAYGQRNYNEGYYITFWLTCKSSFIGELDNFYKSNSNILKFMTIKVEE